MPSLIANARMYAVTPMVGNAWKALFAWLSERSGVPLAYVEHAPPAPLHELWARDDLGAVFMCGFPFALAAAKPVLIAAPIPSLARYRGAPTYCTDLVVRADSRLTRLRDAFGGRIGWTVEHSQSGFNAVRRHLAQYRSHQTESLFSEWVGPLVTPRRVIEAVLAGNIDVGPLDSYVHDLLRRHEPETASRLRTMESTPLTRIPPLIASPAAPADAVHRLRHALIVGSAAREAASILDVLLLKGFAHVEAGDYDRLL
jgi:ABC-type phosphate/phosphonate transport system substrate-binding protein